MASPRLKWVEHLRRDEVQMRYRQCQDPIERSHWHRVWLYQDCGKLEDVARQVGYSAQWVRTVLKRYNAQGAAGLNDGRHQNPGVALSLSPERCLALEEALGQPAFEGGLWSGPKVRDWIEAQWGIRLSKVRGWAYLVRLDYSLQHPRPQHERAACAEQHSEFKKKPGRVEPLNGPTSRADRGTLGTG